MKRPLHSLPFAAVLIALSCPGPALAVEVLEFSRQANGAVEVIVPTNLSSYYILWRNADASLGSFDTPEVVILGTGNPLLMSSAINVASQGFYRVQEEPITSMLDLDEDTMPDAFELRYPTFLNPLDSDDGKP